MSDSGQPLSGSGTLSASVDRVYVNVLNYTNVSVGSPLLGQTFTAVGSTSSYALSRSVVNPYEIVVAVDGAVQSFNNAYSVTSSTINFTESIPSGSLVDIRFLTTPNVNSASFAVTSSFAQTLKTTNWTGSSFVTNDTTQSIAAFDNTGLPVLVKPTSDNVYLVVQNGIMKWIPIASVAVSILNSTFSENESVIDGLYQSTITSVAFVSSFTSGSI
jgi:hypothetical protein